MTIFAAPKKNRNYLLFMKNVFLFLCNIFLVLLVVVETATAQDSLAREYRTLLWKIEHPTLSTPSYLYGTMHTTDERVFRFGDSVMVKFDHSQALALELLSNDLNPMSMLSSMLIKSDTTLKDLYTPDEYQRVKKYLKDKMGFMAGILNVDKLKPIYLSVFASEFNTKTDTNKTTNPSRELPLDQYLEKLARDQKKILIAIEKPQEQLGALDQVPLTEQADMLLQMVDAPSNTNEMTTLIDYYGQQNLDGLLHYYQKNTDASSIFDQAILQNRNIVMADRISDIIAKQSTFVAVGALHLPGVIILLRQKGYQVSPIYSAYNPDKVIYKTAWIPFRSNAEDFETMIPALPAYNSTDSITVKNMNYFYEDTQNDLFFSITYLAIKDTIGDTTFYERALKDLETKQGTQILWKNKRTIDQQTAVEGEMTSPIPQKNTRFLLLRGRKNLYLLTIVGTTRRINDPKVDLFFYRFKPL